MKKNITSVIIWLLFMLNSVVIFAQPGDENSQGNLEGNDAMAAPIENHLAVAIILIVIFTYCFIKLDKNRKKSINN